MKALILDAEARTANLQTVAQLPPSSNEVLVEVKAISLNPIDPLYVHHPLASSGRTIGSDFAGVISSLGTSVPSSSGLKVGDRVSGFLQGACSVNDRPGAFADYLAIPWDLVWKIPDGVPAEEAAGVSLVALTAAQAMWYRLGLQAPFAYDKQQVWEENPEWKHHQSQEAAGLERRNFFIYGASTSVGLHAAQMARLSAQRSGKPIRLFGAASKARWPMLQAEPYRYDHLVDYRDSDWPVQVTKLTGSVGMHYVYDCISEGSSVERTSSTLNSEGKIAIPIYGAVWEGLGEEIQYQGFTVKRSPAARHFAVEFYKWLSTAMGSSMKQVPIRMMPGGLEKVVQDGFALLGTGRMDERDVRRTEEWMRPVSAEKVVYQL